MQILSQLESGNGGYVENDNEDIIPIIENAGGIVSDWLGNKPKLESGAKILACGDKNLHKQAVEFISSLN